MGSRLAPGPHAVGFVGRYERDRSRTFFEKGPSRPAAADRSRPIQIRIWYPAIRGTGSAIIYRDISQLFPIPGLNSVQAAFDANDLELRRYMFRKYQIGTEAFLLPRLLALPIAARRNAKPEKGRFPVLLYAGGANFMTEENLLLWQYLASWGYVVITVPTEGAHSVSFSADASGLETLTRDLEQALSVARSLPYVNSEAIAAAGFSYGGAAAMLMAMRNPDVDAVIGLDASFVSLKYGKFLLSAPEYSIDNFRQPLLEFHAVTNDTQGQITDTLRYSDRWSIGVTGADHVDFTSAPEIAYRWRATGCFPTALSPSAPRHSARWRSGYCAFSTGG